MVVEPIETGDLGNSFELTEVSVGETNLTVAVADTSPLRSIGLMGVESLGDVDGMLFVFEESNVLSFWMKDTKIALDIAFFDGEGALVGSETMEPCVADPCPRYSSGASAVYAIEVPAPGFAQLQSGDRLVLGP